MNSVNESDHTIQLGRRSRRRFGRRRQEDLLSNLGPVLDMSQSGIRILAVKNLRGEINIKLYSFDTVLKLRGHVIWSKRLGFRRHCVGIEFYEMTTEMIEQITKLSSAHVAATRLAA